MKLLAVRTDMSAVSSIADQLLNPTLQSDTYKINIDARIWRYEAPSGFYYQMQNPVNDRCNNL